MRYRVIYDGPDTRIIEAEDGEHRSFAGARATAVEHEAEMVASCQNTLRVLREAGSYQEYLVLQRERAATEVGSPA